MFKQILVLSEAANRRTQHKVLGKCTEELGEIATIINKPRKIHAEAIEFEVADLIVAATDLVYVHYKKKGVDLTIDQINTMLTDAVAKKNGKWAGQLQQKGLI